MSLIVGIDLGTTHSLVGAVVDGEVALFADEEDRILLPSVVALTESNQLLVGRRALNRRLLAPENAVAQIKRRMGEDIDITLGSRSLRPQAISALILGALLDRAERALGERPPKAIITVPAYFDDGQRQATQEAGRLAGLEVERLVNEPTAAALTHTTGEEATVLLYDFGGGTFDVSVLERDEGFLEVRASHGDTRLGGTDIDQALVEHALERLGPRSEALRNSPTALARLEATMERAKIILSDLESVAVREPFLFGEGTEAIHLDFEFDRSTLESLAEPFIRRTLFSVDEALAAAGLQSHDLDRVLLVGGSAKIPLVRSLIEDHLDRPVQLVDDPDAAVARGAALLAGRASGADVDEILVDVTPHTLSVGALDREIIDDLAAVPVIPRNTVVPVERTQLTYTMADDQRFVRAPIVQGEGTRVADNTWLGEVEVADLPPSPAQSPVEIRYKLDISGILHVTATHIPSGRSGEVTVKKSPSRLSRQQRAKALDDVQAIRAEVPETDASVAESERRLAEALLARVERALSRDDIDADRRAAVESAQTSLREALDAGDGALVSERSDDLSGALLDLL